VSRLLLVLVALSGLTLGGMLFQQLVVEGALGPAALVVVIVLAAVLLALLVTLLLSRTRHRELVGKLWLAAFSMAIAYVVIDVVAGQLLIQPLSPPLVPDEHRHHRLVPNSNAEFRQPDFHYVQRVNNLGLRGPDTTVEKPPGTYRILMLGDSFTMGKGVEDDQTFTALLSVSLGKRIADCGGPAIEVLNGGVDSYSPILSYIQLKRDIAPLRPDLVLLNLDVSDLVQETAYRAQAVFGEDGDIVAVPQLKSRDGIYEKLRDWTSRNLFFTRFILFHANKRLQHRELTVRDVVSEANFEIAAHTLDGDRDRTEQWAAIFDSLRRIQSFADAQGIKFVLSIYPWGHQVNDREWVPGRYSYMAEDAKPSERSRDTVHRLAAAGGIELIDLFDIFRNQSGGEPLYFRYDAHWTTEGHRLMARGMEAALWPARLDALCAGP
jgi:hypothetical protein